MLGTVAPRRSVVVQAGARTLQGRTPGLGSIYPVCGHPAPWRSGYAAACKAVYTGSIPVGAFPERPQPRGAGGHTAGGANEKSVPGSTEAASRAPWIRGDGGIAPERRVSQLAATV